MQMEKFGQELVEPVCRLEREHADEGVMLILTAA
jgi:hypothetical protein